MEISKVYITSKKPLIKTDIHYLTSSNLCYPVSVKQLGEWNWLAEVGFENHDNLLNLLNTTKVLKKEVVVKRIFKSIVPLREIYKKEPCRSFLLQVAMGISGLIKKPVNIKITNNRADDWQKELTKIWQKELDNPDIFKKSGIKNIIDISPDGELEFRIIKGENYLITYFNENIDKWVK